ncbi:MAG: RnfH family protein [Thioalkalivibrionaceae bacterium]
MAENATDALAVAVLTAGGAVISVEVAWAGPEVQRVIALEVPEGTTVAEAVEASGVLDEFAEINWPEVDVGIFGRLTRKDQVLGVGDRVEIYRPLIADPKEVRRKRARSAGDEARAASSASAEGAVARPDDVRR